MMQNTMSNGKEFPIAAILSVTTKYGIPAEGYEHFFDGVIAVLDFMTGENLYSHAAVRAATEATPYLLEWYPQLSEIDPSGWEWKDTTNPNHYSFHLAEIEAKHGKRLMVYPMPIDDHEIIDPFQEAINMGYKGEIIEVDKDLFTDNHDDISPYGDLPSKN